MNPTANMKSNPIEPTMRALGQLSPQNQETITSLIRQLAQREGINVPLTASSSLQTPAEGMPLWVTGK